MPVRSTSKAAYYDMVDSEQLTESQRTVFRVIVDNPGVSRNDLVAIGGFRQASVCGRVNELIKIGMVAESGCRKDPVTGRSVNLLYPAGGVQ